VDGKISPDLSADKHTLTESRGDKEQRSLSTDLTVQAPSEPDLRSERPYDTIFRQAVTDVEAVNKELEHLRETLLSTVEELPDPESLSNSPSHDWSIAGAISNLETSAEDLTPLLVSETGRNKENKQSKATVTIDPESSVVVNVLTAVEFANTHEAPTPAGGTSSLDVERHEGVISGPYLEPTASSQIGRNPGKGDFCSGGVMMHLKRPKTNLGYLIPTLNP